MRGSGGNLVRAETHGEWIMRGSGGNLVRAETHGKGIRAWFPEGT